jgi:spermidine synthase
VYALAGRSELSRITSIEIIRPQLATLDEWAKRTGEPALLALLRDPRIDHVSGDGRTFVMRSGRTFDIIEADALRPGSAYSGNLYSVGYFTLLRSHLAAGGIAVTWAPTSRVHDTFGTVFPHVLSFGDILVGSESPIPFDVNQVVARLRAPEVQAHYRRAGIDAEALLEPYLRNFARPAATPSGLRAMDLNEDLFPRDEFSAPRTAR